MKCKSMLIPLLYLLVAILSSYKVDRFVVGGGVFPSEWRIAFRSGLCILLVFVTLLLSISTARSYYENSCTARCFMAVALIIIGTVFASMAVCLRCNDIAIWVSALVGG